ncbi:MAG: succinate dehydrogenase, hydrophobic membrane anchor protein [Alphaproteobacteria bacterium]|jgi:succinate dehydrogenase / fumarate reductase membrane anchor subunit|nr:succinate dehydrogenase, hydrophobic membrane anchor protein [Alphaproteobacteria bacterium]MDP6565616.1 succinate dehydrogenase, hydrophobic membrane anchor protein [Alphaproteobacteria bacterium]MDP6813231.1 succinate dehydrogenase, hydrophobic membrane anchor protein [Alphaproteobacteria bacterium]
MSDQGLRTPLGRVRGLGSAKDGTHQWWLQRLTAIALVPLSVWLAASIASLAGAGQDEVMRWFQSPLVAILMLSFMLAGFWHTKLGLQVVIEDYVHTEWRKITCLMLNNFVCIFFALAATLAVLKLLLGS